MPAIFFALISFLGWGTGDIFTTIASRKLGGYSLALWGFILSFLIASLYAPFVLQNLNQLTWGLLILNIFLGFILLAAFVWFTEGLRIGNPALVGTITSGFVALVVIFSIIFFEETITFSQAIAIVIIFIGLLLSSLDWRILKNHHQLFNKGVVLAILAMIAWGIFYTFIKIPISKIGWFWPSYISLATFPLLYGYIKLKKIKLHSPVHQGAFCPLLIQAVLLSGGGFSLNFALEQGLASIVAPIAGAYPVLFVLLSFLIFKDHITRQQIAGIMITLIGIVALSFLSV